MIPTVLHQSSQRGHQQAAQNGVQAVEDAPTTLHVEEAQTAPETDPRLVEAHDEEVGSTQERLKDLMGPKLYSLGMDRPIYRAVQPLSIGCGSVFFSADCTMRGVVSRGCQPIPELSDDHREETNSLWAVLTH